MTNYLKSKFLKTFTIFRDFFIKIIQYGNFVNYEKKNLKIFIGEEILSFNNLLDDVDKLLIISSFENNYFKKGNLFI